MPTTPKPYSPSLRLLRSIFAGNPKVFSAEDLNRQFDAIVDTIQNLSTFLGPIGSGFTVTLNSYTDTPSSPNVDVALDITVAGTNRYVYYKGVRFSIPTASFSTTLTGPEDSFVAYVYLVAKKVTVDFATDPVMSGISSTEFPTQLPSSDTILYKDERLVLATSPSFVLAPNEEVICAIAAIVQQTRTNPSTGAVTTERVVRYTAVRLDQLIQEFPYEGASGDVVYEANKSIIDAVLNLEDWVLTKSSEYTWKFNDHAGRIALLELYDQFNAKRNQVNYFSKTQLFSQAQTHGTISNNVWAIDDGGNTIAFTTGGHDIRLIQSKANGTSVRVRNDSNQDITFTLNVTGSPTDLTIKCPSYSAYISPGSNTFVLKPGFGMVLHQISDSWYIVDYQDVQLAIPELPVGSILMWSGSLASFDSTGRGTGQMSRWAICNGATYGSVVSPDLRGRFVVGAIDGVPSATGDPTDPEVNPTGAYPSPGDPSPPNYAMGDKGGEPHHKLTSAEMPSHVHGYAYNDGTGSNQGTGDPGVTNLGSTGVKQTQSSGSDDPHNTLPPYYALAFIIRIV